MTALDVVALVLGIFVGVLLFALASLGFLVVLKIIALARGASPDKLKGWASDVNTYRAEYAAMPVEKLGFAEEKKPE